ncbi:hypothetical protein WA026_019662 [Henosepilachna vigintioctopunctata]|uniref:Chaoptin n=1 Tax=Henosepilachna vigintioctopunctata TaxID=420089 RepID=A0AAW1UHK6_9CUCU
MTISFVDRNWIQKYISILTLLLSWNTSEGKCMAEKPWRIMCSSIDSEELFDFFPDDNIAVNSYYYYLKIENSNLPDLETLPMPAEMDYQSELFLTIEKSSLETIAPKCFEKWLAIGLLDLTHNQIRETKFLEAIAVVDELNLSYNKMIQFKTDNFKEIYVNTLNLSHNSINSLNNFTNKHLRILDVSHNYLAELENIPLHLKNLEYIDLSYNKIRKISNKFLSESSSLNFLNVAYNELIILDSQVNIIVAKNNNLTQYTITKFHRRSLDLSNNKINGKQHKIHITGNINSVDYSNNSLESLEFLKFDEQKDIIILTLILKNNKLTKLNFHNHHHLIIEFLDLSENNIEHIDGNTFQNFTLNGTLDLNKNKLRRLHSDLFSRLSSLLYLNLSFNPISYIDEGSFSDLIQLKSLDLSHCLINNLSKVIFKNLFNLSTLNLSNNIIKYLPAEIFENLNLKYLDISHNALKSLPNNIFSGLSLNLLNIGYNEFTTFQRYTFNNSRIDDLILEGLIFHEIRHENFRGLHHLIFLNLSNNGVEKLHFNSFDSLINLEYLNLDNNSIELLPNKFLINQVNLKTLSLRGNKISQIPLDIFSYQLKLEELAITIKGEILEKRFIKLIHLKQLNIVDSDITNIRNGSFRGLFRLRNISFANSNITKIEPGAFNGLRNVVNIDTKNLFKAIKTIGSNLFNGLFGLKFLNISNLNISSIENNAFVGLNSLEIMQLSQNKISNLPKHAFIGLKKLSILNLSYNNLTGKQSTFPIGIFRDLENLSELHLQHNRIIKFQIGEFSNLKNLKVLNLSHNHLSYLDRHLLFPLKNLRILNINSNYVIKYDYTFIIKHLPMLKTIGIGTNKWKCENLTSMLDQFQLFNIDYLSISHLEYETGNIDGIHCIDICSYLYCPTEEDLGVTY